MPEGDLDEQPDAAPDLPADRFSNRELSWLAFNARVLALAEDRRQPLLERMKFLSIFASNLDEFYMVRVAGLKRRADMGLQVALRRRPVPARDPGPAGRAQPRADRAARAAASSTTSRRRWPTRASASVRWDDLDDDEQARLTEYFRSKIFPVLTPLAVDPAHPFPYISGLSLNLAVLVRDPDARRRALRPGQGAQQRAAVRRGLADRRPRPSTCRSRTSSPPTCRRCSPACRSSSTTCSGSPATPTSRSRRTATRTCCRPWNANWSGAGSARRCGSRSADDIDDEVLDLLTSEIDVQPDEVLRVPGLLDLTALWQVYDVDRPALKEQPFVPATHPRFAEGETPEVGVRHPARGRRAGAPPVRVVRHQRAALHRAGRRRPERAGDQADALPHLG